MIAVVSPEIQRGAIPVKSAYNAAALDGARHRAAVPGRSARSTSSAAARSGSPTRKAARRVAIIGADATAQLFGTRDSIGQTVQLNGLPYTVIGKIRKKDQDSNYSGPDNDKVFVPFSAMARDFPRTDVDGRRRLADHRRAAAVGRRPAAARARRAAPAASRTSTGRSSARSAASWRRATASTPPIATRSRCGTRRSRR